MAFFSCFKCFKPAEQEDIQDLDLSHFSLSDVPTEIFNFERTLETLNLESNNIRDLPRQLFHCHGLRVLKLSDNDLHSLPTAVSSLSQLQELDISKNVLTDIPDTIKQCKQLAIFDASVNPLQKIPEGCTQLLSISELYLNDTFLEFLPANFGRLSKLRILELRENGLNTLPKSLSRLTCLERLDLGQNEISELPEVIGSLTRLKELWIDGNRIKQIPNLIGNLTELVHLEASINHIDYVSDAISNCKLLEELALSTNDLKDLPEAIGGLENLVTLKLDDNQIEELPLSIGKLKNLEELIISQNFLEHLPPSIGLCRKLHTLNVDDNDLEALPREIGSCTGLRILSAHGNRLTTLPAELDHISGLSVINLTSNMIHHLPVSLTKLTRLTALWLSENQHKPLVQLNQETDPETGQRVLSNFMLPQTQTQVEYGGGDFANQSDTGSFHASSWEEERARKSQIKWAGEDQKGDKIADKDNSLRREPTPFPKEMRAMAKRAKKLREQQLQQQTQSSQQQQQQQQQPAERKKGKEYRPRMQRKASNDSEDFPAKQISNLESKNNSRNSDQNHENGFVEIREAKVSSTSMSNTTSVQSTLSHSKISTNESIGKSNFVETSPSKITPSESLWLTSSTSFEAASKFPTFDESAATVSSTKSPVSTQNEATSNYSEEQAELSQFEELEKALGAVGDDEDKGYRTSPEKTSRDSGIITPSEGGSLTSPDHSEAGSKQVNPEDFTAVSCSEEKHHQQVKAALVTVELDNNRSTRGSHIKPPPYHIAAAMSKHATDFNNSLSRHSNTDFNDLPSMHQECDNVSEAETTSTAPSSLQTVLRGPGGYGSHSFGVSETETDGSPPSTPTDVQEQNFKSESYRAYNNSFSVNFEQGKNLAYSNQPKQGLAPLSKEHLQKLENSDGKNGKVGSESDAESMQNHAQKLRKVSEQLLGGNARSRQSFTGIPSPGMTKIPTSSRPPSRISHMGDSTFGNVGGRESPFGNVAGRDLRPSSYAGPQNTVGLPALLNTSLTDSKIPKLGATKKNSDSHPQRLEDNGLLSTIEKAAHSDEESSPPLLPYKQDQTSSMRKHSGPPVAAQSPLGMTRIPKISSSSSPFRPSSSLSGVQECNYENVTTSSTAEFVSNRQGKNISTANYVNSPSNVSKIPSTAHHRALSPTLSQGSVSGAQNRSKLPVLASQISTPPTSKIPMRKTS